MKTSDFSYHLPPERIAAVPADRRDASRLLVLDRAAGVCEEALFRDVGRWLCAGDLLVVNSSRVFPARLIGPRIWLPFRDFVFASGLGKFLSLRVLRVLLWVGASAVALLLVLFLLLLSF